jgi:hypothetical protein
MIYPTYYKKITVTPKNLDNNTRKPNLYHIRHEEYRQPERTEEIRAKKTKRSEEPLHGEERHVVKQMECEERSRFPGQMCHEVYDDVENEHTDC